MVTTQHKPVIGSAEYIERPVSPVIQEELSRVDAALPAELGQQERDHLVALELADGDQEENDE